MEVKTSVFSGFCNGVSRSISLLNREIETGHSVFLSSELVHNNLVTENINRQNVHYLSEVLDEQGFIRCETLPFIKESTLVIAAHGVPKANFDKIKTCFNKIVDTTCPIVKKRQTEIENTLKNGKKEILLFVKNTSHSEVLAISNNICNNIHIIKLGDDINVLSKLDKNLEYEVHTQTTFPIVVLNQYLDYLATNKYKFVLRSAECPSCKERQNDCERLSKECSVIVVVGSIHSSNANELVKIAKNNDKPTYLVEDATKVNFIPFKKGDICGLISSASSSKETFEGIMQALEDLPF